MDLISRLKTFLELNKIPITKFADTCTIPRPSMTQLLKGRNKKVSDEVISKIHQAYPSLSVSWLLFGEGEMESHSNFKISEPEIDRKSESTNPLLFDFQPLTQPDSDNEPTREISPEKFFGFVNDENRNLSPTRVSDDGTDVKHQPQSSSGQRRVVNIMVFYSDNSFETFTPQKTHS